MFSRLSTTRKALVVFFIALMPLGLMKTDYYFMSPGPPYQWEITVQDQLSYDYEGNLYQLTVRRDIANCFVYAWAYIDNSFDLYPKE